MAGKKASVGSADIARMAGVSRGTVSKVLNNYPGISKATRERVRKAMEKSGYYPNFSAQALTGKKRKLLGFFSIDTGQIRSAYIMGLMALGVCSVASRMGYQVLSMQISQDGSNLSEVLDIFRQKRVDAGIFQAHAVLHPVMCELAGQDQIVGVFDQKKEIAESSGFLCSSVDNYGCAKQAVDYLYGLGHRKIAFIPGDFSWRSAAERARGFQDGLRSHGLDPVGGPIRGIGFYEDSGFGLMDKLLNSGDAPTAVVCSNDNLAFGAIEAIQKRNLRVPDDISVIGIENNPFCSYFDPPLTTFQLDTEDWIASLVRAVINRVEHPGEAAEGYREYSFSLIRRGSCAMPRE